MFIYEFVVVNPVSNKNKGKKLVEMLKNVLCEKEKQKGKTKANQTNLKNKFATF